MSGFLSSVQGWPWGPIITTILGSGVISALANNGLQWWRSSADRKAAGRLTARRAVQELERYAREIAGAAEKWASVDPYEEHSYGPGWPEAPKVADLDWTGFPSLLVDNIHRFNADHDIGRAMVRGAFEVDDDFGISEAADFSLRIGLQAWSLASGLRKYAGYPPGTSRVSEWYDFVEWMHAEQQKHADIRARNLQVREETALLQTNI